MAAVLVAGELWLRDGAFSGVVVFVYNNVALGSIIKGRSQCAALRGQVHELWMMIANGSSHAGAWFERVPGKLNIAGCPSRLDHEWAHMFHQVMGMVPVNRDVANDLLWWACAWEPAP